MNGCQDVLIIRAYKNWLALESNVLLINARKLRFAVTLPLC